MTERLSPTQATLINRAAILESHRADSLRMARRITGNQASAEDAVQNAFLRLLDSPQFPTLSPDLIRYVRRTVANCAIDVLRSAKPVSELPESLPNTENPQLDMEIEQTLGRLSPDHRAVIALHLGEGYSYREIADALQIPMGTVASRLNQARVEFKKIWGES
ncbi:MAG: RNA polymerase sigma factor [Armatimonadetes bacterium]|nr:RNA polymerase sigma factor [Armatimonadota bacterium]MBS1710274.1 RNA polymerase sigma factor [Armatimonadota bacterium]MBX3109089.1 RNA polymerase sigma factor [Fimbriimonadaceae bacterium]